MMGQEGRDDAQSRPRDFLTKSYLTGIQMPPASIKLSSGMASKAALWTALRDDTPRWRLSRRTMGDRLCPVIATEYGRHIMFSKPLKSAFDDVIQLPEKYDTRSIEKGFFDSLSGNEP